MFINHNTFTNENHFYIIENIEKKYDLFVNSAFDYYKKLHLTRLVDNINYVGRFCNDNFDFTQLNENSFFSNFKDNICIKENYNWLSNQEINLMANQSIIGGIFSNTEGACFSSSQYFLSGLPVISTYCKGGREIWYNEENIIYCDNTHESVLEAVNIAKEKIQNGFFDKNKIRQNHINKQEGFRKELTTFIIKKLIVENENNNINFEELKQKLSYYEW